MAEITVSSATHSLAENGRISGPFWTSPTVGYIIHVPAAGGAECLKTSDAGATWSAVDASNQPAVATSTDYASAWFDRNTAGDAGAIIHVAFHSMTSGASTKTLYYYAFDTDTDSWGTGVSVATQATSTAFGFLRITKAVGGNLYIAVSDTPNRGTWRSTDDGATWSARADHYEGSVFDTSALYPANLADTNDIWCVFFDASANTLSLKTYDDSANSWAETTISASIAESASHPWAVFDAAVRHSDGHLMVAAWNAWDVSTADLLTWDITDSGTITAKTNINTNANNCGYVGVFIDQQTDDIYVAYFGTSAGTDAAESLWPAYYKVSTDGMATWGTQTTYFATEDDYRGISTGHSVGDSGGWFMPVIYNDDLDDLTVDDANGVEIPAFATTVSSVGAIASEEAVPSPTLKAGISLDGIASEEAFGTATLRMNVTAEAIASEEAVGEPTVSPIQAVTPTGIISEEAVGTPAVTPDTYTITPDGIESAEAIGEAVIGRAVFPSSISSLEAFGTAHIKKYVTFDGIASAEAIGSHQLNRSLILTGIATTEAFGTTVITVGSVTITVSGIGTEENIPEEALVIAATTSGFRRPPPGSARYIPTPSAGSARYAARPPAGV